MSASEPSSSIFSQKLDRAAFTAYFLGAIVPLVALAFVVERYVLPIEPDGGLGGYLTAMVASIALLSGSAFLILRQITRRSLRQMDRDNHRLAALLAVSSSLSKAEHGRDAAVTAVRSALAISEARAAYVLSPGEKGGAPALLVSAGADAEQLHETLRGSFDEVAELVMRDGRPALAGAIAGVSACAAIPLPGDSAPLGALVVIQTEAGRAFDAAQMDALSTLAGLAAVSLRNAELHESQRNFFTHVTDILVTSLDSHLGYHSGHGVHVAASANCLGRAVGFGEMRLQRLHFAALLHDIGMLKVDRALQHDTKLCAKHTLLGSRMLAPIRVWQDLAPIVHHHHEWFDGRGYPDGIAGEAIPLESRIIALCDAFDSMTSATSYKAPRPLATVVRELEAFAGTQFDPELVERFVAMINAGELGFLRNG
jgi:HD-GYP domain-containing protein (c-di-GMP phosphodiesterase class II)